MDSKNMNIPLDNAKYKTLMDMLNEEKRQCQEKADEQIVEARSQGTSFSESFAEQEIVKQYKSNMEFLIEHNLLDDIKKIYAEFLQYIESIKKQTDLAKIYGQASNVVKLAYENSNHMVQLQN